MPEIENARVWFDPNTGRLQVNVQGPRPHGHVVLKHVTLRFEQGHGSNWETTLNRRVPKERRTEQVDASGPVAFAPGRYVRLKHDTGGLPAGTRGMISGRCLTGPEDEGKLEVVFRDYIPGSPEYGDLKVPREGLEWDTAETVRADQPEHGDSTT